MGPATLTNRRKKEGLWVIFPSASLLSCPTPRVPGVHRRPSDSRAPSPPSHHLNDSGFCPYRRRLRPQPPSFSPSPLPVPTPDSSPLRPGGQVKRSRSLDREPCPKSTVEVVVLRPNLDDLRNDRTLEGGDRCKVPRDLPPSPRSGPKPTLGPLSDPPEHGTVSSVSEYRRRDSGESSPGRRKD